MKRTPHLLAIQSHVVFGHAGNSAAVFPMQRVGVNVWPLNTVQFSNHTGYGAWKGSVFSGDAVAEVVTGIEERGALSRCDGVLSANATAIMSGSSRGAPLRLSLRVRSIAARASTVWP